MIDAAGPRTGLPTSIDAERPRRHPWIVLVTVLGMIALSVTGAILANYQPLVIGAETGGYSTARPVGFLHTGGGRIPRYVDGTRLITVIWLHNDGPWGVTVTGVDQSQPRDQMLTISAARTPKMPTWWSVAASTLFHPIALKPGATKGMQLVMTVGGCAALSDGNYAILDHVAVRFRLLGVPRTVLLPFASPVRAASPTDADCPARLS